MPGVLAATVNNQRAVVNTAKNTPGVWDAVRATTRGQAMQKEQIKPTTTIEITTIAMSSRSVCAMKPG